MPKHLAAVDLDIISIFEQKPIEPPLKQETFSGGVTVNGQTFNVKPRWGTVSYQWLANVLNSPKPLPENAVPVTAASHSLVINKLDRKLNQPTKVIPSRDLTQRLHAWRTEWGSYSNPALIDIFSPFSPWWGRFEEYATIEDGISWSFWEETADITYAEMSQYATDEQKNKLLAILMAWKAIYSFGKQITPLWWQSVRQHMLYVDEQEIEAVKEHNFDHANAVFSRVANAGVRDALLHVHAPIIPKLVKRPKSPFPAVYFADDMNTLIEWNYGIENEYQALKMQWLVGVTHLSPVTILNLLPYFLSFSDTFAKQYKKRADLFGWFAEWLIARMKKGNVYGLYASNSRGNLKPGLYVTDCQIRILLDFDGSVYRELAFTHHQWQWMRTWVKAEPTLSDFDRLQTTSEILPETDLVRYQNACYAYHENLA